MNYKKVCLLILGAFLIVSCAQATSKNVVKRKSAQSSAVEKRTHNVEKNLTGAEELKKGDQHLGRGKVAAAIKCYRRALEKDPSLARAHLQMARAYGKQRKMNLYEKELKKALEIDPKLVDARYLLASWYFTSGRNKEALEESEQLIKTDPGNEKYRLFRVMIFDANKEYKKAILDLECLVKHHPDKPQYLLSLGGIYKKMGKWKEASYYLKKVKKVAPNSFEAKMADEMLKGGPKKK